MTKNLFEFLAVLALLTASLGFTQDAADPKEEIAELKEKLEDGTSSESDRHTIEKQIAQSYVALGDFENAIEHMQKSINLQEKPAVAEYLALGQLLVQVKRIDDAIGLLRNGQAIYPDSIDLAYMLTFPLEDQERWDEVVEQFETIETVTTERIPGGLNHKIYFRYGAAVERNGDIDKAAQLFQKSLERIPNGPQENGFRATILNYLGYMWVDSDQNIDVAGELIKKAAKLDPDSGAIADSLGWFFFKKERYIEAMNELVRAEALMEDEDDVVMDHIAQTFFKLGNQKEAVAYMEKAIEIKPENEEYVARLKEYSQN